MTPEEIKKTAFGKIFASRLSQEELKAYMIEKSKAVLNGDYSLIKPVVVIEHLSKK